MYRLKNGRLLGIVCLTILIGSCTKTDTTSDVLGNWVTGSSLDGVTRSEAVTFTINGIGYIATGYDGTNRLRDLWNFNPGAAGSLGGWNQGADMPAEASARSSAVGFSIGTKGFVGTGYDGLNYLGDFWEYDPAANSWSRKADFGGGPRWEAVGFGILDKGYITTGFNGNYLKDLWEFDTTGAMGSWKSRTSMGGTKRYGAVAFVYQNKAYVTTGTNNGSSSEVNDLWVFDPTVEPGWTEKRKISNVSTDTYDDTYAIVRSNAVAFVMNDKAYITCGENGSVLNTTWEYDFVNDVWTAKTAFEGVARTGAAAFSLNNRGFVMTGRSSNTAFDDLREFFPSAEYNAND